MKNSKSHLSGRWLLLSPLPSLKLAPIQQGLGSGSNDYSCRYQLHHGDGKEGICVPTGTISGGQVAARSKSEGQKHGAGISWMRGQILMSQNLCLTPTQGNGLQSPSEQKWKKKRPKN